MIRLSTVLFAAVVARGVCAQGALVAPPAQDYLLYTVAESADQLALETVPDPLVGPIVANVLFVAAAIGLAWWSFRRQEI